MAMVQHGIQTRVLVEVERECIMGFVEKDAKREMLNINF
jgi:hypothetical protein